MRPMSGSSSRKLFTCGRCQDLPAGSCLHAADVRIFQLEVVYMRPMSGSSSWKLFTCGRCQDLPAGSCLHAADVKIFRRKDVYICQFKDLPAKSVFRPCPAGV